MKQLRLEDLLAHLGRPELGALSDKAVARLSLGGGRPLPLAARALLKVRAPAWRAPGMWSRAAGTSLRGRAIDELVRETLGVDGFEPRRYWDLRALAKALPGRCHPLDTDLPLAFLYVDGEPADDYPVFTLQQADDVLDVVIETPSLLVYYAMVLGLVASPTYTGGLYPSPEHGKAMRAAAKRCGVAPTMSTSRLFFEAPRKDEPERPPRAPRAKPPDGGPGPAPAPAPPPVWLGEIYPAYTQPMREAWTLLQSADDASLMSAFEAARAKSGIQRVEAKRVRTLRARLGQVQHDYYLGNVLLFFWIALEVDLRRGEAILRDALTAVPTDYGSIGLRPSLVVIAATTFWSDDEVRRELLETLVVEHGDTRFGGIVHDLGRALGRRTGITTTAILDRAEDLVSGRVRGIPSLVASSTWVACVALLSREPRTFAPRVRELGARLGDRLGVEWRSFVDQCTEAVLRDCS